jgi:hypothetical protein
LYGRSIHPELFDFHQSRTIERGQYVATVHITGTGHLVTWKVGDLLLTEVAASASMGLPIRRRLMSHRVNGCGQDYLECHGGIRYDIVYALETVKLEKLREYQKEFALQTARKGLLHQFDASGRFEAGAVSYMNVESRDKVFRVQAFHTFPDDAAVLRVQSTFKLP